MNPDINRKPPDREAEPAPAAPADEKDVVVFYDSEGKAALVLPAEDVLMIVPGDRLLKPEDQPSKLDKPKSPEPLIELQNRVDALENRLDALLGKMEGIFAEVLDEELMRMINRQTEKTE
jgi:hypothetical protein